MEDSKFEFLTSTRFWAMVIGAIIIYLQQEQIINDNLAQLLETVAAGFVGIRTIDRFSETLNKK